MNLTDEPAHWPVVSSAELARGRLVTLRTDGFRKVMKGLTTVDEILRVTENAV